MWVSVVASPRNHKERIADANVGLSVDSDLYAVVKRQHRPGQLTGPDE